VDPGILDGSVFLDRHSHPSLVCSAIVFHGVPRHGRDRDHPQDGQPTLPLIERDPRESTIADGCGPARHLYGLDLGLSFRSGRGDGRYSEILEPLVAAARNDPDNAIPTIGIIAIDLLAPVKSINQRLLFLAMGTLLLVALNMVSVFGFHHLLDAPKPPL
jgi:hypothetical protein